MDKKFGIRLESAEQMFSASHFITFDSTHCEPFHGHDFHVSVALEQELSPAGYVVDFIPLSETLHEILKKLDHKTLLQGENPKIKFTLEEIEPDEQPGVVDWMNKVGTWLSSVNQYGEKEDSKELAPEDYFQKMAQMATGAGMDFGEEEISQAGGKPLSGWGEMAAMSGLSAVCGWPGISEMNEVGSKKEGKDETIDVGNGADFSGTISNGMTAMKVEIEVRYGSKRWIFPMEDCVILPIFNTTAELLAEYIANQLVQSEVLAKGKWSQLQVEVEEAPGMKGICVLRN